MQTIKHANMVAFLTEKNVKIECPACGHGRNIIYSSDDETVTIFWATAVAGAHSTTGTKGHSFVMTECASCGHIRNFAYPQVLDWVNSPKGMLA